MDSHSPPYAPDIKTPPAAPPRLRVQILALTLARTVLNTGHRMIYPFLPTIARGLGVDLQAVAFGVTARAALGLVSPLFGSLADTAGRRIALIVGMLAFAAGMLLVTLWPTYPALIVAMLLAMTGKLIFDPATQAFIGDKVHYTRRGLAIAVIELSWSGAFLLGVPVVGWLIARSDRWQAPFPWLGMLAVLGAGMLFKPPHAAVIFGAGAGYLAYMVAHPDHRWRNALWLATGVCAGLIPWLLYNRLVLGGWLTSGYGVYDSNRCAVEAIFSLRYLFAPPIEKGFTGNLIYYPMATLGLEPRMSRMLFAIPVSILVAAGLTAVGTSLRWRPAPRPSRCTTSGRQPCGSPGPPSVAPTAPPVAVRHDSPWCARWSWS